MNNFIKGCAVACCALPLFACAPAEDPTGVIPQGHLDAMEKAKNVENVLQDAQIKNLQDVDPG